MGVFDDKKFEELDWVSQITEGIESELNGLLTNLPDKLELDYSYVSSMLDGRDSPTLTVESVVRHLVSITPKSKAVSWDDQRTIINCFVLETEGNSIALDLSNHTLTGKIFLVKHRSTLSDDVLQAKMGRNGLSMLTRIHWNNVVGAVGRANEILELLEVKKELLNSRSTRQKTKTLHDKLEKILSNNEWRIRDTELADKIGYWIADYISSGNLAAFSNFCKLKVMTHQGGPIYSIEEQE